MKYLVICFFSAVTCPFFLLGQTTVNLLADLDNTMYSESIDLSNGMGVEFFSGITNAGSTRRALLRFDLSGIPSDATVTSAKLTLFCITANGTNAVFMHKATADWGEGLSLAFPPGGQGVPAQTNDATWGYQFWNADTWSNAGGDFDPTATASASSSSSTFSIFNSSNLVSDIQNWIDGTSTNFGWLLKGDELSNGSASKFSSRQNSVSPPVLEVTYTIPDPCAGVEEAMLSGPLPSGAYSFPDSSLITDAQIAANQVVLIDAIKSVELAEGFEVDLSADVEVQANPCP